MVTGGRRWSLALGGAWLLLAGMGWATEVYKWRDAQGIVHYSETPPVAEFAGLETLQFDDLALPVHPAADYRAALEVAESIEASRLQREQLRLQRRRKHAESPPPAPQTETRIYYPPYYFKPRVPYVPGPGHRPYDRAPPSAPTSRFYLNK